MPETQATQSAQPALTPQPTELGLLDQIVEGDTRFRRCRDKRVQVDAHEIHQRDAVVCRGLQIFVV